MCCWLLWLRFLEIWHKVHPPKTFIEWSWQKGLNQKEIRMRTGLEKIQGAFALFPAWHYPQVIAFGAWIFSNSDLDAYGKETRDAKSGSEIIFPTLLCLIQKKTNLSVKHHHRKSVSRALLFHASELKFTVALGFEEQVMWPRKTIWFTEKTVFELKILYLNTSFPTYWLFWQRGSYTFFQLYFFFNIYKNVELIICREYGTWAC